MVLSVKTVAYAKQSEKQVMDIYFPENQEKKCPAIILVHGGAFTFGDQKMPLIQPIINEALAKGILVASVDYRKSQDAIFPAALADVKAAVRYLKAHSEEYQIDINQMTIWGESAGAYLALMTALTPTVPTLNGDVSENSDQSSQVNGLVSFYAPVEFYTMQSEYRSLDNPTAGEGKFESDFLGVDNIYHDKAACDKSYWKTYLDFLPNDFKLKAVVQVGGEKDIMVPYLQSIHFAEQLAQLPGIDIQFTKITTAKHEDPIFYTQDNIKHILNFLS
ncbi:alpha/beta hydrolase fold domain-containing protein [Streptococcus gallolyticus]|uniref:alpha/beta hydrolase fold domain-containing protein n=1 Tax=Streptococcus gallolyticus TaxID=315405 RepID=UPI003D6E34CC